VYWVDRSSFGRSLRAVRDSEIAAQAVGINPRYAHAGAFAIGTAIAGLAGGLWAHYLGVIKPVDMSLDRSLFFLIYLAVGGIEHWAGALLGTLTLGMLPEVLRFSREYRLAFFGLLLTGFMALRPSGFLSRRLINRIAARVGKIWGERRA
jgi:branched-chain amino acid transport system permease protein